MHYYGTRLSENISRREPEGYLLCLNVPVARTGTQEYLPDELGLPTAVGSKRPENSPVESFQRRTGGSPGGNFGSPNFTRNKRSPQCGAAPIEGAEALPSGPGLISVYRPESEVFAPETIASFEGMPVTNDHPPDGVDIDNIRRLQMGHAHNIRRGTGEESDLLLADLIITDERLIDAILSGKREISCGYTYELSEESGQYIQRKIRGNHIAVVDAGRAGPRVSIKDHKQPERRTSVMKKSLPRLLARLAKDGDVETVAEFIEEMIGEETPAESAAEAVAETVAETVEAVVEAAPEPAVDPVVVEAPEAQHIVIDEESLAGILERLDRLITLLTPAAPAEDDDPVEEIAEAVEEAIEAAEAAEAAELAEEVPLPVNTAEEIAELVESVVEPEVSTVLASAVEGTEDSDDPEDSNTVCGSDALRAALLAVRPALSRMSNKQRKRVTADLAARLSRNRKGADAGYNTMRNISRNHPNPLDLGKRIMASRNPNYHK